MADIREGGNGGGKPNLANFSNTEKPEVLGDAANSEKTAIEQHKPEYGHTPAQSEAYPMTAIGDQQNAAPVTGADSTVLTHGASPKPVEDMHIAGQSMPRPPEPQTSPTAGIDAKQTSSTGQKFEPAAPAMQSQEQPTGVVQQTYKPNEVKQPESQNYAKQTSATGQKSETTAPTTQSQEWKSTGTVQQAFKPNEVKQPEQRAVEKPNLDKFTNSAKPEIGDTANQYKPQPQSPSLGQAEARTNKPPLEQSKNAAPAVAETIAQKPGTQPKAVDANIAPPTTKPTESKPAVASTDAKQNQPIDKGAPINQKQETQPKTPPPQERSGLADATVKQPATVQQPLKASESQPEVRIAEKPQSDLSRLSQSDPGKRADLSANTKTDAPAKNLEQTQNPKANPIGASEHNIKAQAPTDSTRQQGDLFKNAKADQGEKVAKTENKAEVRHQIPIVPDGIPQKSQMPGQVQKTAEAASQAQSKDILAKSSDQKLQHIEESKLMHGDSKGSQEAKTTRGEALPNSSPAAGELGQKKFVDSERTQHEQPISKDGANVPKFDIARGEQTVVEAPNKFTEHIAVKQPGSDLSVVDESTILITDKNTKGQDAQERSDKQLLGDQRSQQNIHHTDGSMASSLAIPLDTTKSGRQIEKDQGENVGKAVSDKGNSSENPFVAFKAMLSDAREAHKGPVELAGRQIEIFKTTEGEIHLAFDDKRTFKLLSELLQQFRTKDIRSTDSDSLAVMRMFAEMKSANQVKLMEALAGKPIDGEMVKALINEKDSPDRALERKEWMSKLAEKEAKLAPLKALIKAAVDPFMQLKTVISQLLLPRVEDHADATRLVAVYAEEPEPIVKQAQNLLNTTYDAAILLKTAVEEKEEIDEDADSSALMPTTNKTPQVKARTKYTVVENDTYESIAAKRLGSPLLADLIKQINGHFNTVDDGGEYEGHKLVVGEDIQLPTLDECQKILQPFEDRQRRKRDS